MKIIIVPHTHWDREWYFTSETSQALWNFNLDNCLNHNYSIAKFYLDGQVSLVEDYLNHATQINRQKFMDLIHQQKLIAGPLYSQPDVFNSLGETTMRNIEIAQKLLKQWNLPSTKTFYCPDTFGFGDSLPQILNLFNFQDFVFWRGLKKQTEETDTFIWKGIEGSSLKCYRLKFGYWTLGSMFNWKTLTAENVIETAQTFLKTFETSNIYTHFKTQAKIQNDLVMFPFGGDQAPIHPLTNAFFKAVNDLSQDEWVIGTFDDFLNHQTPTKTITGILDYGFDSKIHRTITSTRYDFKKLFRENEIALYHQLEPLELYYQHCDPTYISNNDAIIKQLCLMQAHDVLGGCVTDNVYTASYQKLLDIKERIETKQAMLLKQLGLQLNLTNQSILLFNPHVNNKANNIAYHTVYTTQQLNGYIDHLEYSVYILDSQVCPDVDNTYLSNILIVNKALTPMSLLVIDYKDLKPYTPNKQEFNEAEKYNQFIVSYDHGDLFDADEAFDKRPVILNQFFTSWITHYPNADLIQINGILKIDLIENPYTINIVKLPSNDEYINITIDNHCHDIIVKWQSNQSYQTPKYLQHLAIQSYQPRTIDDWKTQGYKDYPLDVEKNSGIIFDDQQYFCTRGTNEFTYQANKIIITLYRSTGYLGKPNLNSRPGVASGLTDHRIHTPLGQLIKTLSFDFKLGLHNHDIDQKLNSFYKTPLVFQIESQNLITSKMERFVFIKQPYIVKPYILNIENGFVSALKMNEEHECAATIVNFSSSEITCCKHKIKYNQIKQVKINNEQ